MAWSHDRGKMRLQCHISKQELQMLHIDKHLSRLQLSPGDLCLEHVHADGIANGGNADIVAITIARLIDAKQQPCRQS